MNEINVNTKFDAGSIEVVNIRQNDNLQFKIRHDTNSNFAQWFYFQLNNVHNQELKISLLDLSTTAYPKGWENYSICVSYDNQYWFRVPTQFDGNTLTFTFKSEYNAVYFAYFEPYSYARHLTLLGDVSSSFNAFHEVLGQTNEGRNIDLLVIGNKNKKSKIWFIARQHPGETMAEWFMEGLIHRLLDEQDPVSRKLLSEHVFYLVPNMNPDGAYNGNLRTNTTGTNLNREWLTPSIEKSPEVYYVRDKMCEIGVEMFFDIHGDEAIPYVFTAGCEENPSFSEKQGKLCEAFKQALLNVTPDYQVKHGYVRGHFSNELATIATSWVGDKFDCLSFTVEMPFKDNDDLKDLVHGWDGRRSYLLGQSFLTAIYTLCL